MNNLIYMDMCIYWTILLGLIFLGFLTLIGFALVEDKKSKIKVLKEDKCRLEKRNKYLREKLSVTQQELYRYTYKLPDADELEE